MKRVIVASIVIAMAPLVFSACLGQSAIPSRRPSRNSPPTIPATSLPTTSTTAPLLPPTTSTVPTQLPHETSPNAPSPTTTTTTAAAQQEATKGYGCTAALAYLAAHAAPGFRFVCQGYAFGHDGMMCDNYVPICPGDKVIVIARPCPIAYMNEASNSLVAEGLSTAPIDPYPGACPR